MIAIWAALFIGLTLGAVEVRRHQRATEALLVAGMRAEDAEPEMAEHFGATS